jgi:hypothetical protein
MMVNALAGFSIPDPYVPGTFSLTSGTGGFVVGANVQELYVTGTGGGAGGGSQCGPNPGGNQYRSGGGGGGSIAYRLAVVEGDTIEVTIGAGGSYACGNVGGSGAAGGDTLVKKNGVTVLTLGGAPSQNGGSGPLAGETSSGYFGTPGYSGARADPLIDTTYGAGGPAGSDYYYSGTGGRIYISWDTTRISKHTASGSFVVPAGVSSLRAHIVAGGGGSAYSGNNSTFGYAYGGGGGGWAGALSVTPGETITVTVGGGGGRAYDDAGGGTMTGATGGSTVISGSFGTITATGGAGGSASAANNGYGTSGAGGTCATPSAPYTGVAGGAGALATPFGLTEGAGGGYTANGSAGAVRFLW